MKERVFR